MSLVEHIDNITGIPQEWRAEILPAPPSVKIELTARCNFQCAFCARSMRLREQKEMDRAFFETIITEMREVGVKELGLFYLGESMLCKWLEDACGLAKDIGYERVFLTTNMSLASPGKVLGLFQAGLDSLKWSFNYCDSDQFTEITRAKPQLFHDGIRNMKAAKPIRDAVEERGHRCNLAASYIEYDGAQGERMKDRVAEIAPYVDEIYPLPLYGQGGFVTEDERDRGWTPGPGNRGRLDNLRDPIPCWSVFREGHITWDGKLSACCFDHDSSWEMGDLNKDTFMDAWNSVKFQELRRAHLSGDVKGTACEACLQ